MTLRLLPVVHVNLVSLMATNNKKSKSIVSSASLTAFGGKAGWRFTKGFSVRGCGCVSGFCGCLRMKEKNRWMLQRNVTLFLFFGGVLIGLLLRLDISSYELITIWLLSAFTSAIVFGHLFTNLLMERNYA